MAKASTKKSTTTPKSISVDDKSKVLGNLRIVKPQLKRGSDLHKLADLDK